MTQSKIDTVRKMIRDEFDYEVSDDEAKQFLRNSDEIALVLYRSSIYSSMGIEDRMRAITSLAVECICKVIWNRGIEWFCSTDCPKSGEEENAN